MGWEPGRILTVIRRMSTKEEGKRGQCSTATPYRKPVSAHRWHGILSSCPVIRCGPLRCRTSLHDLSKEGRVGVSSSAGWCVVYIHVDGLGDIFLRVVLVPAGPILDLDPCLLFLSVCRARRCYVCACVLCLVLESHRSCANRSLPLVDSIDA
ncbi:hypothetical protein B0T19DRAFT_47249 [Cercophora scortea]|uniref:Uncharacterized protein n=1 Tax=Cercophora scortea TaxID=314031 RepID=A0AAE0J5Q8_9PEZI|nr:hypothetical protein B0T19DRAFT_47249 [Cercophora scortea]